MHAFLWLFLSTLGTFIDVLQFMMMIRAIMSWIPGFEGTKFSDFVYSVTEWVILPVRNLFDRMGFGNGFMFDLPFLATFILLSIIGNMI